MIQVTFIAEWNTYTRLDRTGYRSLAKLEDEVSFKA